MNTELNSPVVFGPFQLDLEARQLLRDGQPVPITPKLFEALLLLVQNKGRLVSKGDLMKALWPDSFVCESNLTQTVFMLRKALGRNEAGDHYIVNVPGRGYRFAADLAPASPHARIDALEIPAPTVTARPLNYRRRYFILLTAICLITATAFAGLRWWRGRAAANAGRVVIAVLPFDNFTGDAAADYLSDGFTEEMISKLGRLDSQKLGVIGRTSVMHYKKTSESIESIGRELGAQYLLEGSLQRDGSKVRITAQLIETKHQTHVWARQYDRELGELLTVQDEIAQEIADEIRLALEHPKRVTARQPPLSPSGLEAYDLYLRGRYFWNKRTAKAMQQAIANFSQAIEKNSSYARAYAGLADSYAMMSSYGMLPASEVMPKARTAALKALELDNSLAEAHTSLALVAENYDWDWPTAEREYRTAIELDPNYPTAHHWYAEFLALQGRFEEALAESERARQLDPLSLIIATDGGAIYYFSRDYDRSIERFRTVLEEEPSFSRAHLIIGAYVQRNQFNEALKVIREWHQANDGPWVWAWEAYVYGRQGDIRGARYALRKMQEANRTELREPAAMFSLAYLGMNDKDQALAWLEKACREHSNLPIGIKVDPIYDPLRGDAQFQSMLRHMRLQ